jgi:YD repeat-containing protein
MNESWRGCRVGVTDSYAPEFLQSKHVTQASWTQRRVVQPSALVTFADCSTTQYVFDAGDRVTQVVDSIAGTITRTYDGHDRLTSETTPDRSVSYTYDPDGHRATMTVAGQPLVTYPSLQSDGRQETVDDERIEGSEMDFDRCPRVRCNRSDKLQSTANGFTRGSDVDP